MAATLSSPITLGSGLNTAGSAPKGARLASTRWLMNAIVEQIEAESGKGGTVMDLQTKEAAKVKLNTFWREILLSDNSLVTQTSPTREELWRRAYEIYLSQGATDGN